MKIAAEAISVLIGSLLAACGTPPAASSGDGESSSATQEAAPTVSASATASPAPSATASSSGSVNADGPFVRHPPHSTNSDADGVDECTQHGGNYFSCRGAYESETNPVLKRYLYRIAQGQVPGDTSYSPWTDQGSPPHAEVPGMCDVRQPCGAKGQNTAISCLALAHVASSVKEAKKAHALACKCDAETSTFPAYNSSPFICDAAGKPAFIAPKMKKDEGRDIIACAWCHPSEGKAACKREVERLKSADADLAKHIETAHWRRCQTANTGPGEWSSWTLL